MNPRELNWSQLKIDPNADYQIEIVGCNAGRGKRSIAQRMANAAKTRVGAWTGYINFTDDGDPFVRFFRRGHFLVLPPSSVDDGASRYKPKKK